MQEVHDVNDIHAVNTSTDAYRMARPGHGRDRTTELGGVCRERIAR